MKKKGRIFEFNYYVYKYLMIKCFYLLWLIKKKYDNNYYLKFLFIIMNDILYFDFFYSMIVIWIKDGKE